MLHDAYTHLMDRSASLRRLRGGLVYRVAARLLHDAPIDFMNYGYAPLLPGEAVPELLAQDAENRLPIQLYHRLTAAFDLEGRAVLEVSSGRGGGASYLARYRQPRSFLGVDRNRRQVRYCRERHRVAGLEFACADAEGLDLAPGSFDVALNVEASHCYGRMEPFLASISRAVRAGGWLLWADFRPAERIPSLRREFESTGWRVEQEEDITRNVVRAMEIEGRRWNAVIQARVPRPLRGLFRETAGVKGSRIERALRRRSVRYLRFALRNGPKADSP